LEVNQSICSTVFTTLRAELPHYVGFISITKASYSLKKKAVPFILQFLPTVPGINTAAESRYSILSGVRSTEKSP
jgi:hypothetical protein